MSLFDLKGRLSRLGFLAFLICYAAYFGIVAWVAMPDGPPQIQVALPLMAPAMVLVVFAIIRRLHDRDKSGWWIAFFYGAPLAVFAPAIWIGSLHQSGAISEGLFHTAFFGLAVLASVPLWWGFVEIYFLRGTRGPNRFGPDPEQR